LIRIAEREKAEQVQLGAQGERMRAKLLIALNNSQGIFRSWRQSCIEKSYIKLLKKGNGEEGLLTSKVYDVNEGALDSLAARRREKRRRLETYYWPTYSTALRV
jgi:hypothetical protein